MKAPELLNKEIRILMVTNQFAPEIGGVCTVTAALASSLSSYVTVAAPTAISHFKFEATQRDYDRQFTFPVHRVPAFETELPRDLHPRLRGPLQFAVNVLWTRVRALRSLLRMLKDKPVDVVCIQTLSTYWLARLLRRHRPGVKIIFYLHGEEIASNPTKRFMDRLRISALRHADGIVTVSSFTHDLARGLGVSPEKLVVINNGVDPKHFTPGPKDYGMQKRFHLIGKPTLLCLARLDERKGQDKLIDAMPLILATVPNTVLLIVGGGSDEDRLRQLITASAVSENVILAGPASDEERVLYYRTADVYVMPNRELDSGDTEGFGLVFLEAGACGKPVIGGKAGGVPDAIRDGSTGYLVDGRSSVDIAEACIRLLTDESLAKRFGDSGLAHSSANSWESQSDKFLTFCTQIVDGGASPDRSA